jgi:1,2-diacylglycerol 3-beta-galactosyltransferase
MTPQQNPDPLNIVFLFSDTGGGHRSAATAIIEALDLEYPGRFKSKMIDLFKDYAPPPLDKAPVIYPPLSRAPKVWAQGYRASDNPTRMRILYDALWPYIRWPLRRLLRDNPCDLIVSVHPLMNAPVLRAMKHRSLPFVTVVTDLVSTHAAWFDRHADHIIVPTPEARQRGLDLGVDPSRIEVIGLPVSERFSTLKVGNKPEIRARLGWASDRPIMLLVGGGEGMGPLEDVAEAINQSCKNVSLVIVAGRNEPLKNRLEAKAWNIPARIYGFVTDMPDFMCAADILITKAGPGTISEAFIAGLPIILYSRMPGQEEGNVTYVVAHGAGVWAPTPSEVSAVVNHWTSHPALLEEVSQASCNLARPQSARLIARRIAEQITLPVQDIAYPDRTNN